MAEPVRVGLNALIDPSAAGGSESSALSIIINFREAPGDVDLSVIARAPYLQKMRAIRGDGSKVIPWPWPEFTPTSSEPSAGWARRLRGRLGEGPAGRAFDAVSRMRNARTEARSRPSREQVDQLLDEHGIEVVHFTYPVKWPTRRPYIFEPHDIQQHHFPEFFPPDVLHWRRKTYSDGIANAALVVCGTWWTKRDIMRCYGAPANRIAVIPRNSAMGRAEVSADQEATLAAQAKLPEAFAYYPAMTFPHKNHLRLLEALALIRARGGQIVHLVCSGRPYGPHQPALEAAVDRLGLRDQVHFLGVVSDELLAVCYRRSRLVVFPSLLEGHSQSLLEALHHARPIVAAQQSSIPETVGEAAVLFDALDLEAMAAAIGRVWGDATLRDDLAGRCRDAFARYDWSFARLTLTACYKSAAGRPLSPEEEAALSRALQTHQPANA